ncbi:CAAX protease self-immunity [Halolactibacillus miurensis]|uniref:CAAX protease self-immunity n=2 Tax=Halolactibacillus miurensis TaxID=306541 RepID=A0A1I6R2F3_9BACI|nr:CAAX protease self-immunity [Halolactibacillus miurensis]
MMDMTRHKRITALILFITLPILMAPVDLFLAPNYWVKSFVKIILFILVPLSLNQYFKWVKVSDIFVLKRKQVLHIVVLAVATYGLIVLAYLLLKDLFDFSMVTGQLASSMAITKNNFLFVFFYIPLVNAMIEEGFFRGFGFLTLNNYWPRWMSYTLSAFVFSLYHVAIMAQWFSPVLFLLLIASLVIAGLFFNYINEKTGSILTSYVIHAGANLAINTIGLSLFGII